jgi:hypothetical protein
MLLFTVVDGPASARLLREHYAEQRSAKRYGRFLESHRSSTLLRHLFDILVLRKAFDAFDTEKCGKITCDNINVILDMLGHATDTETVRKIVSEIDHQGTTAGY